MDLDNSGKKGDFVVAYLPAVKEKVVVPEHYINGYNMEFVKHLKNMGNNSGRNHLIFWSNQIIDGKFYPKLDQNAKELDVFPPPETNGWYKGRTLFFTDDFDEAKTAKERKRKITPAVYNNARLSELPLPVLVLVPTNSPNKNVQADEEADDEVEDPLSFLNDKTHKDSNVSGSSGGLNDMQNTIKLEPEFKPMNEEDVDVLDDMFNNSFNQSDDSNVLENTNTYDMNGSNNANFGPSNALNIEDTGDPSTFKDVGSSNALNIGNNSEASTINDFHSTDVSNTHDSVLISVETVQVEATNAEVVIENPLPIEDGLQSLSMNEKNLRSPNDIDKDISYEQLNDEVWIDRNAVIVPPIKSSGAQYQMKAKDIISGNMPFASNDMGDRSYIVTSGTAFKQVTLTKRIVDGLMQFNSPGFRDSVSYDMKFVKVLRVACIGRQKIAANEQDPLSMGFIKDLYGIRKTNIDDFNKIAETAIRHIKNNNYN